MNDLNPGRIRSRWRRLIFKALLYCLVVYDLYKPARFILVRYARYRFRHWLKYPSPRAMVHWAGASNRPRRLERVFIAFVLVGGFFALETQQLLLWATAWGGLASVFVIWQSFCKLIPRRQYHWIHHLKGR